MKFVFKIIFSLFLLVFLVNTSFASDFHFATTNMTWAEFYSGETQKSPSQLESDGLDAISSPTTHAISRFPLLVSSSNDNGSTISGVKDVQVRMTHDVFNTLSNDSRYSFTETQFSEYKDVTLNNNVASFGKMISEISVASNARVTLSSGASSTWGNYTLSIASADINIGLSNDKIARNYLGATLETSDGTIYALRHDCNLWSDANTIAFCINSDYVEPHGRGIIRDYDYTASLAGKTITKITYMLKNIPDVVINCNTFVKNWTNATITTQEPENGYLYPLMSIPVIFNNVPAGVTYNATSAYTGSGRNRTFINDYKYSNGVLTSENGFLPGDYTVIFSTENYIDIAAKFTVFSTNGTNDIISNDNNIAGLAFMITPKTALSKVDEELEKNNLVNATDYTDLENNYSTNYSAGIDEIQNSGFSFDITLKDVPSGKTAIIGFGKQFYLTPENCGSELYAKIFDTINSMTVGDSGYREISDGSLFKTMGLKVMAIQPDSTLRDVTEFTGAGAMISDDSNILIFYGAMLADCNPNELSEGEYILSPEGETLLSDGKRDNHIIGTWYFARYDTTNSTPDSNSEPNSDSNLEPNSDSNSEPNLEPNSDSNSNSESNSDSNSEQNSNEIIRRSGSSSGCNSFDFIAGGFSLSCIFYAFKFFHKS